MKLFSTEQISKYHPDKYADQISDAILTECLKKDKSSKVACETMVKDNTVVIAGEITTRANIQYNAIINRVANKLGYKVDKVIKLISEQSPQINNAVVSDEDIGAGDQGIMFGYATRETESFLPYGFDLANKIIKAIEDDINENPETILKGDAKTQVTVDLDEPKNIKSVKTIVVSVCHLENIPFKLIKMYVMDLLKERVPDLRKNKNIEFIINPSGKWTIGGPTVDCGLTGRKIVCDQYGGYCPVGGGAFSGKDPSKVDRTAAYMARQIACDLLNEFNEIDDVEIQLGYAIGIAKPVSVDVKYHINGKLGEDVEPLIKWIEGNYNLTPRGMIEYMNLLETDFEKVSEGCHFRN